MKDYLNPTVAADDLRAMSSLALAHMGDAVYEILVRGWLCTRGRGTCGNLHRETVAMVRAEAQAEAVDVLLPLLTEAEAAVYRRGRNAHVHAIPKNASRSQYGKATGLEALFGWLYLRGQLERINELFEAIVTKEEG
jgi:ribonuclease-3 family protein